MLDFNRVWFPYIYLYGVGGGIFLIGMFVILRSKSLKLEIARHKEWFHILVFGILFYMGIHAFFTFTALGEMVFASLIALIIIALAINLIFILFIKPKGIK
ncbi:MAG: hypothetical protein HOB40_00550 [Candidatus Marinimicrobia bacterium]|jgi:hypothetical protein|nr:hypothetical protein [Candidatus Neomarinimicrobiota bacterium]MBT3839222.1 hypothetical protein [Candidatus Neomarinimicrobiota bacterium]MBT3999675.1 hypothetical protein [Candidatus Neomarinimicrobiota bacterium]MBT4281974.1 hypothetical protein [Candidatus Neomarinimicrobiota bacterium]MBT4579458.1 hypothetical protein [Candidatus Neomarinimicrobiota bacterium]